MNFVPYLKYTVVHAHVGSQNNTPASVRICPSLVWPPDGYDVLVHVVI